MIHPAANEAALRHLNAQLARVNLDLAVSVGNLAWKDAIIKELEAKLEIIESDKDLPEPDHKDETELPVEEPEQAD